MVSPEQLHIQLNNKAAPESGYQQGIRIGAVFLWLALALPVLTRYNGREGFCMNDDLKNIRDTLQKNFSALQKEYHVRRFGVFGSVARGEQKKSSDIDMLVEFSEPIGLFQFVDLEDTLKTMLGRDVDLVTPRALKPFIKDNVLRQTIYV